MEEYHRFISGNFQFYKLVCYFNLQKKKKKYFVATSVKQNTSYFLFF